MNELDVQKLAEALKSMPAPGNTGEWTVFAILILCLVVAAFFLYRDQKGTNERLVTLTKETTVALSGNTAALDKVSGALDRLTGEVRGSHDESQRIR